MSAVVESHQLNSVWGPPAPRPLDEAVWQAWVAKGRAQDRRDSAARLKVVKWMSIVTLLATTALWSRLGPFETAIRFLVTAGAMFVMAQMFQARHYAVSGVFGALALLYNPIVAAFGFSGDWQRALVVASAAPFVASLVLPNGTNARTGSND